MAFNWVLLPLIQEKMSWDPWKKTVCKTLLHLFTLAQLLANIKLLINKWLRIENIHTEKVVYVGDEVRDIDAAKKTGIKVIAVGWGFNSQEALAAQNPDFLIERPQELIEIINSWH